MCIYIVLSMMMYIYYTLLYVYTDHMATMGAPSRSDRAVYILLDL